MKGSFLRFFRDRPLTAAARLPTVCADPLLPDQYVAREAGALGLAGFTREAFHESQVPSGVPAVCARDRPGTRSRPWRSLGALGRQHPGAEALRNPHRAVGRLLVSGWPRGPAFQPDVAPQRPAPPADRHLRPALARRPAGATGGPRPSATPAGARLPSLDRAVRDAAAPRLPRRARAAGRSDLPVPSRRGVAGLPGFTHPEPGGGAALRALGRSLRAGLQVGREPEGPARNTAAVHPAAALQR